jgi:hypothetical protein
MEPARKFKIIVNSKECGTCSGSSPSAVAKKVVKKLCGSSSNVVKFSLKECKRGRERVCGPYQGRMEKLDKPYKRDGKKITHRVVCGKVRKMRGGQDLVAADFNRPERLSTFNIEMINGKPHVFFGGNYKDFGYKVPFKFVVFNRERVKFFNKKSIGISVLEGTDVKHDVKLENISLELQYELSRLREFLKDERKYETIREFLKNYDMLQNIKEQTFQNIPDENYTYSKKYYISYNPRTKLVLTSKYSILFFGFFNSEPRYCLVFTNDDFIIIDFKQLKDRDKDIISIEDLFGKSYPRYYIYLLAKDDNVLAFIKEKLNKLIFKEKEIIKKIMEYFKKFDLKYIESYNSDDLIKFLKKSFKDIHNEQIFDKIIKQQKMFIKDQIKKSKKAHMNNTANKTISGVYGTNINNQNNYQRFFNEGKLLANAEKNEIRRKKEENAEKARKKEEENAEKARKKEEENAEKARKKAEENAEKARKKAEENAEKARKKAEENAKKNAEKAQRNAETREANEFNTIMKSNFNKKKYTPNQKNINMVKNFIEEYYKKDNYFMSKLLMWYCNELSEIYKRLSYSFKKKTIIKTEFDVQLKQDLTAKKLYNSENFPKNNSLNYTYEELKAFANFFIDTLNDPVKKLYENLYSLIISRKNPITMGSNILFRNLEYYIISALEKLGIDYIILEMPRPETTTTSNNNQQQQPATTTSNNNQNEYRNNQYQNYMQERNPNTF